MIAAALTQPLLSQLTFGPALGPEGTSISSLAKDSSGNLYAAGTRIFRSTDQGANWTAISPEMNWSVIAVTKNGTLYAGTGNGGAVMRSTNNGTTWSYVSGIMGQSIHCITIDPLGRIYVGSNTGLYRSSDGVNFSYLESVYQNITYGVAFNADGVYFASTMSGIFRSSNYGTTWSFLSSSLANNYALVKTSSGAYLAAMGSGVYRSTDRCVSWTKIIDALSIHSIAIETDTIIFAGGFNAMLRSSDDGVTWISAKHGLWDQWQKSIISPVPGTVLTANRSGVNKSTDHGASWSALNSGFGIIHTRKFAVAKNGDYFAGTNAGVFRSTNKGASWIAANTGLLYNSVYMMKLMPDGTLFVGPDNGLYRSSNSGVSWQLLSAGIPETSTDDICLLPSGTLLATQFFELYRSTDGGTAWAKVLTNYNFGAPFSIVAGSDSAVYGTDGERIVRSTDDGRTWTERYRQFYRSTKLAENGVHHFFAVDDYNGIFRSTDDGRTWPNVMNAPNNSHMNDAVVNSNGWIYASNELGEVYESRTTGRTWTLAAAFTGESISELYLDQDGFLYVIVPGRGTYRSTASTAAAPLPMFFVAGRVDLGRRRIHRMQDTVITYFNPGMDTLRISSIARSGSLFTPQHTALTVPPHSVKRDTVSVNMNAIGPYSDQFIIHHNAVPQPDTVQLRVFGHGVPKIRFTSDTMVFPAVARPNWKDTAAVIHNDGDDTLFITDVSVSAPFINRSTLRVLPHGMSIMDSLRFSPDKNGYQTGRLVLTDNTERGKDTLFLRGTGVEYPVIFFHSWNIWLGPQTVGKTKTVMLGCYNTGYDTLTVMSITGKESTFTAAPSSFRLVPNNSPVTVTITFAPKEIGEDSAFIILFSNTKTKYDTIRVHGIGVPPNYVPQSEPVTEYGLEQNYPNPFNPGTTIVFQVPVAGQTTLTLYDMLGREIRSLFISETPQGRYAVPISADGLASGMYLYVLQSGRHRSVKKLLLLK